MKRKLILCFTALILLSIISASAATWTVMKVTVDGARVRKSAGDSDILLSLKKGTRIISTGKANKAYYKVITPDGQTGYIFRDHVEAIVSADSEKLYKTTTAVNLRKKASISSGRVKKLSAGEYVQVISTADGWSHVKTLDGKKGYVNTSYLAKVK